MRKAKACLECRQAKRKCFRKKKSEPCIQCEKRNVWCSAITHTQRGKILPLNPEISENEEQTSKLMLSPVTLCGLVDEYLDKLHDRPYSLFHPPSLRASVRQGNLDRAVLFAICSTSCRFSGDPSIRSMEPQWTTEAKRLTLATLENISLNKIQTCILIANLCAAHSEASSEALFFRIAIDMSQIMRLTEDDPVDTVIEREVKRRTWWTLYMADHWCSSALGLPRQISLSLGEVDLPMDEILFHSTVVSQHVLDASWKPGLWAHMITLVELFGLIQDFHRRIVRNVLNEDQIVQKVQELSQRLDSWQEQLPADVKLSDSNLQKYQERKMGGPFIALHLGYHHYSTLLYFQFLDPQYPLTAATQLYRSCCKYHASSYSSLVTMSRQRHGCEVVYPTVGHMLLVSSSVLLHSLLFGDEDELPVARNKLKTNFQALLELQTYWPSLDSTIARLDMFQKMCLFAAQQNTYKLDKRMVRFLIEYALPLEWKEVGQQTLVPSYELDAFFLAGKNTDERQPIDLTSFQLIP